jgi:hypothetical protein
VVRIYGHATFPRLLDERIQPQVVAGTAQMSWMSWAGSELLGWGQDTDQLEGWVVQSLSRGRDRVVRERQSSARLESQKEGHK